MADVDELYAAFLAAERERGDADPAVYLEQVSGVDRLELEALIDGYLARAPRRAFDRAAFEASPAARAVVASLAGSSGTWPALLPRLRHRAQLRRAELVARLAAELGVGGREEKVATYYHAMERGTLPARGVSDRVLDALARIVGESAAVLRAAGAATTPPASDAAAFTRVGTPDPAYEPAAPPATSAEPGQPDEVDALFTGAA